MPSTQPQPQFALPTTYLDTLTSSEGIKRSVDSVIKESFITAADGKSYCTKQYNLEMLIALAFCFRAFTLSATWFSKKVEADGLHILSASMVIQK